MIVLAAIVLTIVGIVNRVFGRAFFTDARETLTQLAVALAFTIFILRAPHHTLILALVATVAIFVLGMIWVVLKFASRTNTAGTIDP